MKLVATMRCADIHSPYCPCMLAETNHCFMCSHLKGEAVCDCNWTGVCLLNEKYWQKKTANGPVRREIESELAVKQQVNEHTYIVEAQVDADFAQALDRGGSFVFLRCLEDPEMCNFPVGIMQVSDNRLQMAIETVGPKSSRLFLEKNAKVLLRGPYYNGVLGQPWIDSTKYGTILVAVGGLGQSNALMIAKQVLANHNEATFVIAPGSAGAIFVADELRIMGVEVYCVPSMRRAGFEKIKESFTDSLDLVISAGPDAMHSGIIRLMYEAGRNYPMAATNNATMCCGEGLCGSCARKLKDGQWVRICKTQLDFTRLEDSTRFDGS